MTVSILTSTKEFCTIKIGRRELNIEEKIRILTVLDKITKLKNFELIDGYYYFIKSYSDCIVLKPHCGIPTDIQNEIRNTLCSKSPNGEMYINRIYHNIADAVKQLLNINDFKEHNVER
jgi:hypothetical protein